MKNTEIRDQAVALMEQAIELLAQITDPAPQELRGVFHGAYIDGATMGSYYGSEYANTVPWDPGAKTQTRYEQDAGKSIAISHFGTGSASTPFWDSNVTEMVAMFNEANARGCYPLLDASTASVLLGDITKGNYDAKARTFFQKMAAYGKPWLFRLNTEMNGGWYGYGRNSTQGSNQTANFKSSWSHLWDIADSVGANKTCSWHWAPNAIAPWDYGTGNNYDHFTEYYPGDKYVDWTGFVCYQQSKTTSDGDWSYLSGPSYKLCEQVAPSKPMMVSEWSSFFEFTAPPKSGSGTDKNKGEWLQHALSFVRDSQPAIRAMIMFNTGYNTGKMEHNEIQTSAAAMAGFKAGITDPIYIGKQATLATTGKVPVPVR